MTPHRHSLLPLEDLDASQFEAFVLQFLASGVSLAVIEEAQEGDQKAAKAARYQIVTASLYGASGPGGQRGIDIRAVTENGAEWVFQCKHYSGGYTLANAQKAVAKAEEEYPTAARYFLVLGNEPIPTVRTFLDPRPKWQLWGISELSVKFFNEVPRIKQLEIIKRFFPARGTTLIAKLYPQHDDLLIPVEQFFARWLGEERLFSHGADLVARQQSLQALDDFVADPEIDACILFAPGGVGKTRLLRAFGETFAAKHAGKKLYFVDPSASAGIGSDNLRAAGNNEIVLVQDDAHRSEVLRPDIAAAVIEKEGKLLFSTRPQAVEALEAWLAQVGVEHARIKIIRLPALDRDALVSLASEILPPNLHREAEPIVERSHGSALIVSVAARLVAAGKFTDFLTSPDFQRAVFARLEEEGFAHVAAEGQERLVRDTLRLIAVLAPWKQETVGIDPIVDILGCTPREFQDNFERLRAAGLLNLTREGWRVVPDLFADYLVFGACYEKAGQLTPFAKQLQAKLLPVATGTMLRNLAEAEWQAQLEGQQIESLLEPFWQSIREQFLASDFFARSQLVKEWARFGVLQPKRSMQLAQLAISTVAAPTPTQEFRVSLSLHTHGQVLSELPELLEPIATYHAEYRTAALDLLWELHKLRGKFGEHSQNEPLNSIGKVAKFQVRLPVDKSLAVVNWLAIKLQGADAQLLCDQPTPTLSVILKPVFEHEVEDSYSVRNTVHLRAWAIDVVRTRKVRARALEVLEQFVIPRGEAATLNALAVLTAAIDLVRWRFKSDTGDVVQAKWLPERRAGLAVLERILRAPHSPRVAFKIYTALKNHAYRDPNSEFKADCQRVMDLIPDNAETRLVRLLLSNAYEEFYHNTPRELGETRDELRVSEKLWEEYADKVAGEFLAQHHSPLAVLETAELLVNDYERAGMSAQFSDLFLAISRSRREIAADVIDLLLAKSSSSVDFWWTSLFATQWKYPDQRLIGWTQQVLRGHNYIRWRALQNSLRWVGVGEMPPEVQTEIAAWAARLEDADLAEALLAFHWTGFRGKLLDDLVIENLNLEKFSEENLLRIANALEKIKYVEGGKIPASFLGRFITVLGKVRQLDKFDAQDFLQYIADHEPLKFFQMLRARVESAEASEREDNYWPIPYRSGVLIETLPQALGYEELARDLFSRLRQSQEKYRSWWQSLFQMAVLRVSPVGLEMIKVWADEVTSADDLESLIDTLKFEGSMYIFTEVALTRKILQQIHRLGGDKIDRLTFDLAHTASPQVRGYTNHELDPEHRYYRDEAAKAAAIHANDPELGPFYREIIRSEDADVARQRRWVELESSEWD